MMTLNRKPSRRNFLKFSLAGLVSAFIGACERLLKPTISPSASATAVSTNTPESTPIPTSTSTPTETPTSTPIPCFELLAPEDSARLNTIGRVTFSWEPMPGAASYFLEITLPTDRQVVYEALDTNRDLYLEAFSLGGLYSWQVTAKNETGEDICTAGPFSFEKPEYVPPAPTQGSDTGSNSSSTDNGSESSLTGSISDISEA